MNILITLLILSVLVIGHELGHFLLAKKNGIGVIEFSVGMGPRLFAFDRKGTKYSWKLIPFGGSCQMVGEDEENDAENSFNRKSPWARFSVIAAGPVFNFILAFLMAVIYVTLAGVNPAQVYYVPEESNAYEAGIRAGDTITRINDKKIILGKDISLYLLENPLTEEEVTVTYLRDGESHTVKYYPLYETYQVGISYISTAPEAEFTAITEGSPAEKAGLKAGDKVLEVNGTKVATGAELYNALETYDVKEGNAVEFTCERDGKQFTVSVAPEPATGISLGFAASAYREKGGALSIIRNSFSEVRYSISNVLVSLKMLVTGKVSVTEVSGPVGIVSIVDSVVEQSSPDGMLYIVINLLSLSMLLSANLGVMNLLPLPALDGGRLVFILLEIVRGKPISREKEGMVHAAGLLFFMALMVLILFNDISKLF